MVGQQLHVGGDAARGFGVAVIKRQVQVGLSKITWAEQSHRLGDQASVGCVCAE